KMKGKTLLFTAMFSLFILFFVNIGAFVMTDIGDFPGNQWYRVGESFSWVGVPQRDGIFDLFFIPIIVLFNFIGSRFLNSHNKKNKLWKKIAVIICNVIILLFSFLPFFILIGISGEHWWHTPKFSVYWFTISTTGTVYILYFFALLLVVGAILMAIEGFKLPNQQIGTAEVFEK
ncbi:MAG: hypothetical protein Q8L64_01715, partial [bacterium]|nr:hypothetical protein [bacterium]